MEEGLATGSSDVGYAAQGSAGIQPVVVVDW